MDTTRRTFVGMSMAAATFASNASQAAAQPAPRTKSKFWIAGVTPCDKNYEFDAAAYKEQFQWWKSQGADGILVLGTNGEGPSFTLSERKKIAEFAVKNRNGLDIIVTTGTPNLKETIELSQHAAAIGADSVLVQPPFYFRNPDPDGIVRYFKAFLDKVSSPVHYYHIPQITGVPIDVSVLQALKDYPQLIGMKNSRGNPEEFEAFSTGLPSRMNILSGTDNNMLAALKHGNGVILGSGNVYTKFVAAVFAAHRAGQDPKPAFDKLMAATSLMQANGYDSNYNAIKYALNQVMGVNRISICRLPHVPLSEDQKAKIRAGVTQLKAMG